MAKKISSKSKAPAKNAAHPNARYKTDEQKKAFILRMKAAKAKNDKIDTEIAREALKSEIVVAQPPMEDRVNAKLKATSEALKTFVSPPNKPQVAYAPRDPRTIISAPTEGKPPTHTMAKSYLRSGAPGLGKKRGATFQCTVSFTESQMNQVVAAAGFRGVSLAEMIRSCVVTHLNTGL